MFSNTKYCFIITVALTVPQGETVIKRDSTENINTINDWSTGWETLVKAENALRGEGQFILDQTHKWTGFPQRFILPKGLFVVAHFINREQDTIIFFHD